MSAKPEHYDVIRKPIITENSHTLQAEVLTGNYMPGALDVLKIYVLGQLSATFNSTTLRPLPRRHTERLWLYLILNAGRHMKYNANTLMRNPEWNEGKRACTVSINPAEAEALGLTDGQQVRVTTEAGSEVGELQVSDQIRHGSVLIPHGFGLIYEGKAYGINVNRLTKNTHRDPIGTPLHRFVPCRVEAVSQKIDYAGSFDL